MGKPKSDVVVTEEMSRWGMWMYYQLGEASFARHLDGRLGGETWAEWKKCRKRPHRDLLIQYALRKIDVATAVFIAMSRVRDVKKTKKPNKGV